MKNDTEIIEMQIDNSFIEQLMIISDTEEAASEAAKKWCEEHNCSLEFIDSDLEQSSHYDDSRIVFYAKVCPANGK